MDFKQFYKKINFDIDNEIRTSYQATQGDTKSRGLLVDLIVGGVKTPVTTETMNFFALKPDGTRIITAGVKDGDKFRIDFTNQTFAVAGTLLCALVLYGTNGEKIADKKFKMTVDTSLEDGAIVSEDERSILDRAFDLASDIVPRLEALDVPLLENLEQRIDDIITTPVPTGEIIAEEIIDARDGEDSLGAKIRSVDTQLAENTIKLDNTVILNKNIRGGQFPKPFRVPVLTTVEQFPNSNSPFYILHVDGSVMYGVGIDGTVRKSTDKGKTWEVKSYQSRGVHRYGFIKTQTGALLGYDGNMTRIIRSDDDGETWENAFEFREWTLPLGSQSMAIDRLNGYIYFGEYNTANFSHSEVNLYISKDDGITWEVFKSFPYDGADRIRHIHAVQWDHVAKRIVICIGDGTPTTGLWRVNQDGTDVEPIVTNEMLSPEFYDAPRAIGFIPFENYIAWGSDSGSNPHVFRMARSEIGKPNPIIERIYRLNSTAWFSCKASNDGSTWVITSSQEFYPTAEDNLVHVYAVTDEGASVWEVGSLPHNMTAPASSLMPIGEPGQHGDEFALSSRAIDPIQQWVFQLGRGFGKIDEPKKLPPFRFSQTVSTGSPIEIAPNEEIVFGYGQAPFGATSLHILDVIKYEEDRGGVSLYSNVILRDMDDNEITTFSEFNSARHSRREGSSVSLETHKLTGGRMFKVIIKNTHGVVTKRIYAHVVFAFG